MKIKTEDKITLETSIGTVYIDASGGDFYLKVNNAFDLLIEPQEGGFPIATVKPGNGRMELKIDDKSMFSNIIMSGYVLGEQGEANQLLNEPLDTVLRREKNCNPFQFNDKHGHCCEHGNYHYCYPCMKAKNSKYATTPKEPERKFTAVHDNCNWEPLQFRDECIDALKYAGLDLAKASLHLDWIFGTLKMLSITWDELIERMDRNNKDQLAMDIFGVECYEAALILINLKS